MVPARRCSFARLRRLCRSPFSILRALEYETLADLELHGRVLDVGGGARDSYLPFLRVRGTRESLNIDPARDPTHVADLNGPLPLASSSYDTIITLNTLEHVREEALALSELVRLLKPGGRLLLFVPFLYRVHGSPSDYHRHTAAWWEGMLAERGMDAAVQPLGWGRFGAGYSIAEFGRAKPLTRFLVLGGELLLAAVRPAARNREGEYPMGYFIEAIKRR